MSWEKSKVKDIIDTLGEGDTLIVQEMSHLSASMLEIRELINIAAEKKFLLYEIKGGCEIESCLINTRIKEKRLNPDRKALESIRVTE
jgi:hypothetical protein